MPTRRRTRRRTSARRRRDRRRARRGGDDDDAGVLAHAGEKGVVRDVRVRAEDGAAYEMDDAPRSARGESDPRVGDFSHPSPPRPPRADWRSSSRSWSLERSSMAAPTVPRSWGGNPRRRRGTRGRDRAARDAGIANGGEVTCRDAWKVGGDARADDARRRVAASAWVELIVEAVGVANSSRSSGSRRGAREDTAPAAGCRGDIVATKYRTSRRGLRTLSHRPGGSSGSKFDRGAARGTPERVGDAATRCPRRERRRGSRLPPRLGRRGERGRRRGTRRARLGRSDILRLVRTDRRGDGAVRRRARARVGDRGTREHDG